MSGGLMGLVKSAIYSKFLEKEEFIEEFNTEENIDLHLFVYVMNESGLGSVDEYHDYFVQQLNKMSDDMIMKVDDMGNTLLHQLCHYGGKVRAKFSYRLFQYFIIRGIDIQIKNKEGKTCIEDLLETTTKWSNERSDVNLFF